MSNFSTMTVAELKSYADENDIDLEGATRKSEIIAKLNGITATVQQTVIGSDKVNIQKRVPTSNTRANQDNVTTVGSADTFKDKEFRKDTQTPEGKIAIYSEKNVYWNGIGRVSRGYNIVTKEAAQSWLTRKGIREASPQEVASHYGL
jgi:hypothetical protein